jgi:hypothetical protein
MTLIRSDLPRPAPKLLEQLVCPHCWERYSIEEVVWVSEHAELRGDTLLGPDFSRRFLPSRFSPEGDAIDAKGKVCTQLACPQCHLPLPRSLLNTAPLFVSVLGTPGSGKSCFLTSAMWKLRETLPHKFAVAFTDADLVANQVLVEAEESLFLNPEPDDLLWLGGLVRKTGNQTGNTALYDSVMYGAHTVSYIRPFMFTVSPMDQHPSAERGMVRGRVLCLYDNAGEHFLPGEDTAATPVTRHLAISRVVLFLYDPTQDPRFRDACQRAGRKPPKNERDKIFRQETTLNEAAARARKHAGLAGGAAVDRLLIVVVSKYDAWAPLLDMADGGEPWRSPSAGGLAGLDVDKIEQRSAALEQLLMRLSPEIVSAAKGFASDIVFIPASAVGETTEIDPANGNLCIRPRNVAPVGVSVPFLYALYRTVPGLIPRLKRKRSTLDRRPGRQH